MTKPEKITIIIGLLGSIVFLIYTLIAQFQLLNNEIENLEPTHQIVKSHQKNGILLTPQMARVIQCESGWNQYKLGDGGRAIGLAQFHEDTFLMFQKQSGIKGSIFDAYTQLKIMEWALKNQKDFHWTCK